MGARTASVYDAFGNAFVIKVSDLFSKNEVLHQGGAAISGFKGVLIIVYANTLIRGKEFSADSSRFGDSSSSLALSEPYPAPDGISEFEILSLVAFEAFVLLTELLVFFPLAMVFPFQLPDSMNLYQHVPNQTRPTEARYKRVNYRAPAFFAFTFVVLDFFAWQLR